MSSPNPILSTIIFVFTIQAILLSGMLFMKRPRKQSNIFLSLLVFFFALMALNIALVNVLITYDTFYVFRYVQLELMFGIGPALYFYAKSITNQAFKFSKKDYIHFLPVLLEFIFYRTAFYRLGADGMYQTPAHPYTKIYLIEQWLGVLSITVYCFLSLHLLHTYHIWLKQNYADLENKSLNWVRVPVIFYSAFWIGWNVFTEIDRFLFERALRDSYFLPTFVGLAIVTCWIGFKGYINSQIEVSGFSLKSSKIVNSNNQDPEFVKKITLLMETEKPYLNSELNLTKLSELLAMNPKQVSAAINKNFSQNFYEYVNRYRVESFKKRMSEPDKEKLTLLGHAFESGFKSKSTFNHVFKKMTGKTPSEYVKQLEN